MTGCDVTTKGPGAGTRARGRCLLRGHEKNAPLPGLRGEPRGARPALRTTPHATPDRAPLSRDAVTAPTRCRLHMCTRSARERGRPSSGGRSPFPKVGRRGRRTKARFPQCGGSHAGQRPCRPAAGRGACHSSGVASKSPFKLRDCGDAKLISTRRQRHSLHAARNARILHLTTGGLLDLGTVTSQSPEAAGKGVSLRPPSQCHVTHTHTLSVT